MRRLTSLIIFVVFYQLVAAQKIEEGAPITLKVSPSVATPGSKVTMAGTTLIGKTTVQVTVKIKAPDGKIDSLKLTTTSKAEFSGSFANTQKTGWYAFTVITADGKNKATDSLYVSAGKSFVMQVAQKQFKLSQLAYNAASTANQKAGELPASTGVSEFQKKTAELKTKIGELRKKNDEMITSMSKLMEEVKDVPKVLEKVSEYSEQLEKLNDEMETKIPNLEAMLESSKLKASQCDDLNNLVELIGFISLCYDFQGKFAIVILNLASDKALPKAVDNLSWKGTANEIETKKFAINESQKSMYAASQGFTAAADFLKKGFIYDLGQYITKVMYNEVCTEIKSSTLTSFRAEFDADGPGSLWWTYDVQLKGVLTLRYDKQGDFTKAVAVTGEFEGITTKYDFWEDFEKVEKLPKNLVLYKRIRTVPKTIDLSVIGNDLGMVARNMVPGSYRVKVKGEVIKNKLTLQIDDSPFDGLAELKAESNKLHVIALSPIVPIPLIKRFDFPIASPKVIMWRSFNGKQEFTLQEVKDKTVLEKTFDNKVVLSNGSVVLKTNMIIQDSK